MSENMPPALYGVWCKAPEWTEWTGEKHGLFNALEDAQRVAAEFTRTMGREAIVYRAYPVEKFTHAPPNRAQVYAV